MTRHPRLFGSRANRASNLLEEFPTGPVSFSGLVQISTASASRLKAYDLALQLLRTAATATLQIIKTGSSTYKPHRLPPGGGFLQVAVSEPPLQSTSIQLPVVKWALQIQH